MLNTETGEKFSPTQFIPTLSRPHRPLFIRTAGKGDLLQDFALSVARGLSSRPRRLECRFLYDAPGSRLYEQITLQPEYYPTRTETAILARSAPLIRSITGPGTLVELGSGNSTKTDHLLRAWTSAGDDVCYVPVDVSESALRQGSAAIASRYPEVSVLGLNSTYEKAFPLLSDLSPAIVAFLGSTIGNLDEVESAAFFSRLCENLADGDFLLLGIDLIKEPPLLEAAYNDRAGVTASFTRNIFARMNRELGCTLDLERIEHRARWRPEKKRIEIHGRFTCRQSIRAGAAGPSFTVDAGEEILVEISRKYDLSEIESDLARYGLKLREGFTDERGWFALLLLEKTGRSTRQ